MIRRWMLVAAVGVVMGCTGSADPVNVDTQETPEDTVQQEVVFDEVLPEDVMVFDQGGLQCKADVDCAQFDDGDLCNGVWGCEDGDCMEDPGSEVSCPPSDSICTQQSCNPDTGACEEIPVEGEVPCDDGDECTLDEKCIDGACMAVEGAKCNDDNPCTDEVCEPQLGCVYTNNQNPCDDVNLCTVGESCMNGLCQGGTLVQCDDQNPCTEDACTSVEGCVFQPNTDTCDDGNECTTGDQCVSGTCVPGPDNACDCLLDDNCLLYDDGNPCNGTLGCQDLKCVTDLTTVVNCPDPDPTDCVTFGCDEETGDCAGVVEDDGKVCNDGSVCSQDDQCSAGECVGTAIGCDDGNPCTVDLCNDETACYHDPADGSCDDGDPCSTGDFCSAGVCQAGPENSCDKCQSDEECAAFDDDNLCNGTMICVEESCAIDPGSVVVCDQAEDSQCAQNQCNPATGQCEMTPFHEGAPCLDGSMCTDGDVCLNGQCVGIEVTCKDDNLCTSDACDPDQGCVFAPNEAPCDDGDPCSVNDVCAQGECTGGGINDCNDDNECTADGCDSAVGCMYEFLDCDDHDMCTDDSCDPAIGCVHHPVECNDGLWCTGPEACSPELGCVVGDMPNPDDGIECTEDLCDEELDNYVHIPNHEICQDDDLCTDNVCDVEFGCVSTPVDCTDDDPSTKDWCDPAEGCINEAVPCDDDNLCTQDLLDVMTGECVYLEKKCSDDSFCTIDSCDPAVGCLFTEISCEDDNPCTEDYCEDAEGCHNLPSPMNGEECDDGDPCTGPDKCHGGDCIASGNTCIELCDNGEDDDNDSDIDCADSDCADDPYCDPEPTCVIEGEVGCGEVFSGELLNGDWYFEKYPCVEGLYPAQEQVFEFVAPCTTTAMFQVENLFPFPFGQDPNMALAVLDAEAGCNVDACLAGAPALVEEPAVVELDVVAGHKYYLVVDGFAMGFFPQLLYALTVDCKCPVVPDELCDNDKDDDGDGLVDCADPNCDDVPPCKEVAPCNLVGDLMCGDKASGTLEPEAVGQLTTYSCTANSYLGAEQIYGFKAQCDGPVTVTLEDAMPFPFPGLELANVLVLDGWQDCGSEHCIAVGEEVPGSNGLYSLVFDGEKGHLYYVVVDGSPLPLFPDNPYSLNISCDCPDEVCGNGEDDDGNGLTDCDDPVCEDLPECQVQEPCQPIQKIACQETIDGAISPAPGGLLDTYSCSEILYSSQEHIYSFTPPCSGDVTVTAEVVGLPIWPNPDSPPANVLVLEATDTCTGDACIAAGVMDPDANVVSATFEAKEGIEYYVVMDGGQIPFFIDIPYVLNVQCECSPQPVEDCSDGHDNDFDDLVDCDDPDCKDHPACPQAVQCETMGKITCGDFVQAEFEPGNPDSWSSYPCDPGQNNYTSQEHIYQFQSQCDGQATVTYIAEMQLPFPLPIIVGNTFLLDSAQDCSNDSCLTAGKPVSAQDPKEMQFKWNISTGDEFYVVADGMADILGVSNGYTLTVDCICAVP